MELVEIEWSRCLDGYTIEKYNRISDRERATLHRLRINTKYFESDTIHRASFRMHRFRLLRPALFLDFINWEPTPAGMRRFCDEFGPLDAEESIGTPVDWLLDQQQLLATAWRAFENGNPGELIIGLELEQFGACNLRLRPAVSLAGAPKGLRLSLIPRTLREAMWAQFALYAVSGTRLVSCEHCGNAFFTGSGTKRRNTAIYCTTRCKVRASQARRESAIR